MPLCLSGKKKGETMFKKLFLFLVFMILIMLNAYSEIIIDEDFSGTFPPTGWATTSSSGQINWQQGNGSNAGGTAPEAEFDWSPSTVALQRLISLPVNTVGAASLDLEFVHTNNDFSGGYSIWLETTSDGNNWNIVTTFPASSFNAVQEQITIMNPDVGSPTFQLAWVFDGDTWNINYWYVDDVLLSGTLIVYDNDLAAIGISGPNTVYAGSSEVYEVTVKNVGNFDQDIYTVKLMREGNIELASLDITDNLPAGEQVIYNMVWNIPEDEPQALTYVFGKVILAGDENPANDVTPNHQVQIYPPGLTVINVGNGTELNNRLPVCFFYKNSLTESLYFPDEINSIGLITAVKYYNNFTTHLPNKPTRIWMGETTLPDLSAGWIPSTNLTPVFDGNVTYPSGANEILIELTTPYFYTGDNLVVMVNRPWEETTYSSTDEFYVTETLNHPDRTRYERDNVVNLNPANPGLPGYTFEKFPNTTFYMIVGGMGSIEGHVYDDLGSALQNVEVKIEDTQTTTYTNADGFYQFNNVLEGFHDVTATYYGFSPQTIQVEVLENQTTVQDFNLIPLGTVDVYGYVAGSDFPTIGLDSAEVLLTGFENYQVYTNNSGYFEISGVYTNITYDILITYEGYDDYTDEVQVSSVNLDLGTIILNEVTIPPGNVVAIQNETGTEVELLWNSPGSGGGVFRYDDDDIIGHLGFSSTPPNGVFGAAHMHHAIIQEVTWMLKSDYNSHTTAKIFLFGLDVYGIPDQTDLLHQSSLLPNVDDEWNTYELADPIEAPNGFLVGVCTPNLYTSIGLDDGIDEPWVFQPETQFSITNWTDDDEEWVDIGNFGFEKNMAIRAYGIDLGIISRDAKKQLNLPNRVFESYNVYRFLQINQNNPEVWDLIGSAIIDTFYTDTSWAQLPNGVYQFAVTSVHTNGIESIPAFSIPVEKTQASNNPDLVEVSQTKLLGNYPNPFNPETIISFSLTAKDAKSAKIEIYNLKGQKVKTLECDESLVTKADGVGYSITWNGRDENNQPVSSGIYFYKLKAGKFEETRKMLLLK